MPVAPERLQFYLSKIRCEAFFLTRNNTLTMVVQNVVEINDEGSGDGFSRNLCDVVDDTGNITLDRLDTKSDDSGCRDDMNEEMPIPGLKTYQNPQPWDYAFHGKLYCRNKEKGQIVASYNRTKAISSDSSKTELIMILGETGVGKTALARSIRSTVLKDGGYFISGKFDQLHSPEPYSAFIAALTEFSNIVTAHGTAEAAEIRKAVEKYIKTEQGVLSDMIPSLNAILDPEGKTGSVKHYDNVGVDATNRFRYVFRMFMKAISSIGKPFVFVLDDLHWADESSLGLLNYLIMDSSASERILYIVTYRGEASMSTNLLDILLTKTEDTQINPHVVCLQNFEFNDLNAMLSETLKLDLEWTKSLANFVHIRTKGNIFFISEFLQFMHTRDMLIFDQNEKKWKWNFADNIVLDSFGNVSLHDFITSKLQQLPEIYQTLLKYAACLGTKFDAFILQHLLAEPVLPHLHTVSDCGFVEMDETAGFWKFTHDGIQEAAYNMIPPEDRSAFHYRAGRKLWRALTLNELDDFIFVVVGQLRYGTAMMSKQEERTAVAKLCFRAGERAVQLSSFRSSFGYLSEAISLLEPLSWRNEYDFCLSLYNAAAEVAYCNGDFDSVYELVEQTFQHSRLFDHTIQSHSTKLYALGTSGRLHEAVETGLSVLNALGEYIPRRPSKLRLNLEARRVKKRLDGHTNANILELPLMHDPMKLSAMKVLSTIFLYAYMVTEELAPLIGFRMVMLTLDHGQSAMSSLGFLTYGIYLCGFWKDVDEGFRFGRLGLQMYEKIGINQWIGRIFAAYYGTIHAMKMHSNECIEPLKYAHLVALEKGDLEYAFLDGNLSLWFQLQATSLPDLNKEIQTLRKQMALFGQDHNLVMLTPMTLTVQNLLLDISPDNTDLRGDLINDNDYENIQTTNKAVLGWSQLHRMWLNYLLGHYENALKYSEVCMSHFFKNPICTVELPFLLLFVGLVNLEHFRRSNNIPRKAALWVKKCLKVLKKCSLHAPSNALGKQFLLEAELAAFRRQNALALTKFTAAIALAKDSGFIMETALSYERTAKFLVNTGERERAVSFFQESLSYYRQWGAKRKETLLMIEMRSLFGDEDAFM